MSIIDEYAMSMAAQQQPYDKKVVGVKINEFGRKVKVVRVKKKKAVNRTQRNGGQDGFQNEIQYVQ